MPKTVQLTDHPEYVEAADKLAELEARHAAAQKALQEAQDASNRADQSEDAAIRSLLAGSTAVAAPSIAELAREADLLARACLLQTREVNAVARRIEQEATAGADRMADDADTREVLKHLQAAADALRRQQQRRAEIRQRFLGYCSLPELALQQDFSNRLHGALAQFKVGAKHFGVTAE